MSRLTDVAAIPPLPRLSYRLKSTTQGKGEKSPLLLCRLIAVLLTALMLSACASKPVMQKPPASHAMEPRAGSLFAPAEDAMTTQHGPDKSGFNLLERSDRALQWRLALIDSAKHSIDLQYYVWFGDSVGKLMMFRVIQAADRGVKVRILFDDLSTILHDMTHVELRDALLARVDRHPNIEIRVFNAWQDRSLLGRVFDSVADFQRLNRRMHNKQMVVDNRAAIIGGRNLGDEYFGLNPEFNFHDMDVLGIGPVARQASAVFDRYWNSDWVRSIPKSPDAVVSHADTDELSATTFQALVSHSSLQELEVTNMDWRRHLDELPVILAVGTSQVHTDSPSRAPEVRNHMPVAFRALMRSARREVLITNAYIIPDENLMSDLRELAARGVKVSILTNSLASHDVPAVNSHYQRWRKPILQTGASLYELRSDAAMQSEIVDLAPLRAEFVGLHSKAMVIDRERSFIGSMNLDPRSEVINSEMGVIIDSPALAQKLTERMLRDMTGANSWQVTIQPDGNLLWVSSAGERTSQPARNFWQRVEDVVFKLFPSTMY